MSRKPRKKTAPSPPVTASAADAVRSASASASSSERNSASEQSPIPAEAEASPSERARLYAANTSDVAALLECQAGFTRGMAMMGQAMLGLTRESMQGAAETGLALIDSRSLPNAWALSMQLARDQIDRVLRSSAELTDIGWRTATAAYGPLFNLARAGFDRIEGASDMY